jgi:TP901 family phage tail tape measure protein
MARDLRLQVMLNAVDRVTGPLKRMREGAGKTAQAMRETRDRLKTLQATQKDVSSFRTLKNQTNATAQAMREQQERVRRLSQQMQANQGDTVALANERRKALLQARQLSQQYDSERQKLQRLRTSLNSSGVSTNNLSQDQQRLANDIRQANTRMEEQKQKLRGLADQQRRAAQARDRYQNGMGNVARAQGVGMGMLGTGIAQGYAASRLLTPGVAFGESMSGVQALTRLDADDERFLALQRQARELGATTAFSATQAADAQGFLGMAGFDSEAIQAAMPDMLNLALANRADLARTADISSNILSGFGLDPKEMQRVADVLTATTTRANVDLSMLGESMKYVAPQAKAMNMSLEQSAAMAGLLGNVGIQGSQAGTTLRAMVTRLAAPTGAAAGALDTLGVNAKDAQGNLRDIPNILSDVARATSTMGNADQAGFLKAIFGEEPGAGMAELIAQQGTEGIEAFVELLNNSMGEAARVAQTRADNIGGDLKGLRSAWEDVGISITETNKGPIRDLIQNITSITRGVSAWIEANPELTGTIAKLAAGMIALATVGGAITMTLAGILGPLLFTRFAMTTLGIKVGGLGAAFGWIAKTAIPWVLGAIKGLGIALLTTPIGWFILGIAAIAGAAYLIYKNWEPIKAFFKDLWDGIKLKASEFWNWFEEAPSNAIDAVKEMIADWDLKGAMEEKWDAAIDYLKGLPSSMVSAGADVAIGLGNGIKNGATNAWDAVRRLTGGAEEEARESLDTHSPSRVFRSIGIDVTKGLANGIQGDSDGPLKQVRALAINLRNAAGGLILGAGLSTGAAANVDTSSIQIDARPPLQSHTSQSSGGLVIQGGINIQVHAAPGMDEQALARLVNEQVQRALQQAQQQAAAANRRNFHDND